MGNGRFPGHPSRQSPNFVSIDGRVKTQSTLIWAKSTIMLDPVTGEHLNLATAQLNREMDHDLIRWPGQDLADILIQVHEIGRFSDLQIYVLVKTPNFQHDAFLPPQLYDMQI
jgi:hypothetical protein